MNIASNGLTFREEKSNNGHRAMVFKKAPNLGTSINPIIKTVGSNETGKTAQFTRDVSSGGPKAGDIFLNGENERENPPGCTCRLNISTTFQIVNKLLLLKIFKYSSGKVLFGASVKPVETRKEAPDILSAWGLQA